MRSLRGLLLLSVSLGLGCAARAPLGDDWEELDGPSRDARAVEALEALFEAGVTGAGSPVTDRRVVRCDGAGVTYRAQGSEELSEVRWADVESVESQTQEGVPARPETLYLYLRRRSPSVETAKDAVRPPLASTGIVRSYVELRWRPRRSRDRLLAALEHLRRTDDPEPAEAEADPGGSIEAKLRALKRWHQEGLIDDEEYEAKRKALLERL